jgi:hypothetical protein
MTNEEFSQFAKDFYITAADILFKKSLDYADEKDSLVNFKRLAERLRMSPIKVWSVYATKQFDAILTFVLRGNLESESIESRFIDLANFALLGAALVADKSAVLPPVATGSGPSFEGSTRNRST